MLYVGTDTSRLAVVSIAQGVDEFALRLHGIKEIQAATMHLGYQD